MTPAELRIAWRRTQPDSVLVPLGARVGWRERLVCAENAVPEAMPWPTLAVTPCSSCGLPVETAYGLRWLAATGAVRPPGSCECP